MNEKTRTQVLHEEPICTFVGCEESSTEIENISPRHKELKAGRDPDHRANLRALCSAHHTQRARRRML